ncbi:MAG: elongation factor P [Deltaproteobacteria bacterium]|nr:elongation factor P [bacterium]MCB9476876.1 elongation factor P [Deltaproteobacteria bacterium]MCB9480053.1 elongation factor P [Deltaproteobacteria bacterium]MCB9489555.1 elongation factor P [Deltaproteobacteria bacterium]
MSFNANRIRAGMVLDIDGEACKVMEATHITPGKGNAVVQTKMRNLKSGIQFEKRFRAVEQVDRAILSERLMEFLYAEGDIYHFMDTESFEQIAINSETLGSDVIDWLTENMKVTMLFYDTDIVGASVEKHLILRITDTAPQLKGATATNSPKPATLENGVVVNVPPFIESGEMIKVDTETRSYVERYRE